MMDKDQFLGQLKEALMKDATAPLDWDTPFRDGANWSSLASLMVISMFYSEYDLQMHGDELKACLTAEDLYQLASSKLEETCTV